MRNHPIVKAERHRVKFGAMASNAQNYGNNGSFCIPYGKEHKEHLGVIVSDEGGWDHISVSLQHRCPTWEEMCFIKELFFKGSETVLQYHPALEDYVNDHPYCLHLWRPQNVEIPKPPKHMVGTNFEEALDDYLKSNKMSS